MHFCYGILYLSRYDRLYRKNSTPSQVDCELKMPIFKFNDLIIIPYEYQKFQFVWESLKWVRCCTFLDVQNLFGIRKKRFNRVISLATLLSENQNSSVFVINQHVYENPLNCVSFLYLMSLRNRYVTLRQEYFFLILNSRKNISK